MDLPAWHPCLSTPDFLEIKVWEVSLYPESRPPMPRQLEEPLWTQPQVSFAPSPTREGGHQDTP